jgi:tRNA-splicing ligase RtcB
MTNKYLEAMIFGMLLGDGWISERLNCGFSGDLDSLQVLKDDLINLYGDIGKANISSKETVSEKYNISGTTNSFVVNKKVTTKMLELGAPTGKRVEKSYNIPDWIMNSSLEIKKGFLSGYYAAEGYAPSMQKNGRTPKPLGFTVTKRKNNIEGYNKIKNDFIKLLLDLQIPFNIKEKETYTCDHNIRLDFIFLNNSEDYLKQLKILDMRYCNYKEVEMRELIKYFDHKDNVIKKLVEAYYRVIYENESATLIANEYNINRSQIYSWKKRKTGICVPKSFIKYEDFKKVHYKLR